MKTGATWAAATGWGGPTYTASFAAGTYWVAAEVRTRPWGERDAISTSLPYAFSGATGGSAYTLR